MRLTITILTAIGLGVVVQTSAQPPRLILHETDETLSCPCVAGNPIPYGTTAFLMVDVSPPGHGPEDVLRTWFVWCGDQSDDCEMVTDDLFLPPHSYYVRVGVDACCWSSAPFAANSDVNDIELSGWTCSEGLCRDTTLNPRGILTVDFTGCLHNVGCPCDNPQPLPPDSPVRFWRDMPPNGISPQDMIMAEFEIGSGSGWEHSDCRWIPSPEASIPWGHYYFTVQTNACCWRTEIIELTWGNLWLSLSPTFGQCYEMDCRTFEHPPWPVESVTVAQQSDGTYVTWTHDHHYTDGYRIVLDGAVIDTIERFELGTFYAGEFFLSACISAFNEQGNSTELCDSVDVALPTPPTNVRLEHIGPQSRISWVHDGANIENFGIWADSVSYVHVPATEREWTFDRDVAWACANSHNAVGWSVAECDTATAVLTALERTSSAVDNAVSVHPNPFNLSTLITYNVDSATRVSLQLFDITGRQVALLFAGFKEAGSHTLNYSAQDLPSGVYFLSLSAPQQYTTTKLLLLK